MQSDRALNASFQLLLLIAAVQRIATCVQFCSVTDREHSSTSLAWCRWSTRCGTTQCRKCVLHTAAVLTRRACTCKAAPCKAYC